MQSGLRNNGNQTHQKGHQMSRVPEAVARVVAYSLDGEFDDNAGLFFDATPEGCAVRLTVRDAETDEKVKFILTIEAVK